MMARIDVSSPPGVSSSTTSAPARQQSRTLDATDGTTRPGSLRAAGPSRPRMLGMSALLRALMTADQTSRRSARHPTPGGRSRHRGATWLEQSGQRRREAESLEDDGIGELGQEGPRKENL